MSTEIFPVEQIPFDQMPSPCFVLDESRLKHNLEILKRVQDESGAHIICALKGYSMWSTFPMVRQYLYGATASSLNEALLAKHEMGKEVHVYVPAYSDEEFPEILDLADHITFNTFTQWERFKDRVQEYKDRTGRHIGCAIRINPEYSENKVPLYDPCVPFSRLGVTRSHFKEDLLDGIDGLHFHTLSAKNSDTLERTLEVIEEKFGDLLPQMKWINFGGGHHITNKNYDVDRLIRVVKVFREKWNVDVILEPGEAVGWQTGWLVSSVLDTFNNGMDMAMLDVSVSAHMPDCLEMPYRPDIRNADEPGEKAYTYRLGGGTCLAGDIIGDYSFDAPLQVGSRVVFEDMIHYTMVKTTFFNGVKHPSIGIWTLDGQFKLVKHFSYEEFKAKLS